LSAACREFLLSEGRDGPTNWRAFENGKWKSSRPNFQIGGGNYLNISSKEFSDLFLKCFFQAGLKKTLV